MASEEGGLPGLIPLSQNSEKYNTIVQQKTMDGMMAPSMLSSLCDMMRPPDEESDSDEDKPVSSIAQLTPGCIGPAKKNNSSGQNNTAKKDTKDIWDAEEVQEGAEFESIYDPRPQPEYDIVYKQAVTSEDMFLQMGNKTPSTASCEEMVVKVKLPGTKLADVTLDVKTKFLDCRTPNYFLGLHLPHPVDSKSGKAQWDGKSETLNYVPEMIHFRTFVVLLMAIVGVTLASECCDDYYDALNNYKSAQFCSDFCCGSHLTGLFCCSNILLQTDDLYRSDFCYLWWTNNIWAPIVTAVVGLAIVIACCVCCYRCCCRTNTVFVQGGGPYMGGGGTTIVQQTTNSMNSMHSGYDQPRY
ncbi:hypothetical protein DPMN_082600 [Dreissena polymorpha]|uniref:PIH1D1/2/3 CS-like domain-containing protein n=1 Tax=Dreissena polymorpha TaxID=45954 RepID=A0A9D3YAV9_DREPO|nr:hypothetical protein DPMN_082600 [Dreissena polymorpha]